MPVGRAQALATAGAMGGTPGSPTPPGAAVLAITCTAITGMSRIRIMR
ncbi:hypothetical protein V3N99_20440 [Dermatophilaceae bacterium Soc4.6]